MIWEKKQILIGLFLLLGALAADGRRFEQRSYKQRHNKVKHYTPLLRQLDTATNTDTAEEDDDLIGTGTGTGSGMDAATSTGSEEYDELNYDNHENDTKPAEALILINPKEGADTSRMFKGFFLRRLLGSGIDGGGNGGGNANVPYFILNSPNNITNVNINSLNNTVSAVITNTTTTTTAAPARRRLFYQDIPFTDTQTEIYHQRRSKPEQQAQPQNFIRSPNSQLMPVYLPPEIQYLMQSNPVGQRRRAQLKRKNVNYRNNLDPFSFLGNSLGQIQYL